MSPSKWGPPIWTLFHTLAEQITDEGYNVIGKQLYSYILKICKYLPCPDCSNHATIFFEKLLPRFRREN